MKHLTTTLILTLLMSMGVWTANDPDTPISDPDWTRITSLGTEQFTDDYGNKKWTGNYINFNSIEIAQDGLIYFWTKFPFIEGEDENADAFFTYFKVDCKAPKRIKKVSVSVELNDGTVETFNEEEDWLFPLPTSGSESIVNLTCTYTRIDKAAQSSLRICLIASERMEDIFGFEVGKPPFCWERLEYEE